jgi:hypothetical protein
MERTFTNWKSASALWKEFAEAYPELGYSGNTNSWIHFQRRHGERLKALGIIRQTGARGAMIADADHFERIVFDLLTLGRLSEGQSTAAA